MIISSIEQKQVMKQQLLKQQHARRLIRGGAV